MRQREIVERSAVLVVVVLDRIADTVRDRRIADARIGRAGDQRGADRLAGREEGPEGGGNAQNDHAVRGDTGPRGKGLDVQLHRHPVFDESHATAEFGLLAQIGLQVTVEGIERLGDADVGQAVEHIGRVRRGDRAGQGVGRTKGARQKGRRPEIDALAAGMLRIPADVIADRASANAVPRQAHLVDPELGQRDVLRRRVRFEAGQHVERVRGGEAGELPIELATEIVAQLLAEHFPVGINGEQVDVLRINAWRILHRGALRLRQGRTIEIGRNGAERAEKCSRRSRGARTASALHLGIPANVCLAALIHRLDRQRVSRLEQYRRPERTVLDARLDRAAHAVDPVAFAVLDISGQTNRQHILDHRKVDRCLDVPVIGRCVKALSIAAELGEVGLLRCDRDGARNRRRAARGALRPAQHFDLADVEDRHDGLARVKTDFVEIDRRGGRARTRPPRNAAQRHLGAGTGIDQGQARGELAELVSRSDRQLLQLGTSHHLHRDRHVLQLFIRTARGDDDFAIICLGPVGLGTLREGGEGCGQRGGCRQQANELPGHDYYSLQGRCRPNCCSPRPGALSKIDWPCPLTRSRFGPVIV